MIMQKARDFIGKRLLSIVFIGFLMGGQGAAAQSAIPNPLRPAPAAPNATTREIAPAPAQTAVQANAEKPKPKRERSAKQKQGDDDMRACGANWKANKPALTAKGETWRSYLKTCRGERKAARG